MPPPNANDPLHVGHAMFVTIEDILIRYHRMLGDNALWLPGTDHAGIETQYVFEKKLNKEGKSRFSFDRESLYQMIWDYVQGNSHTALEQMKRLGATADWTRTTFTLDKKVVDLVLQTFEKMHGEGLVYRGLRLINYCTKCGTGYSELEVKYTQRNDPLYYLKYGPFTIATVRPESKFRDTALAVHPKDKRYAQWVGKTLEIPGLLGPISMKVIADEAVDPEFGTGIMKVTPAHDPHDFELGKKYNLPVLPIIDFEGKMDFSWFLHEPNTPEKYKARAEKYHGKKVVQARALMVEDLKEDGLLVKTDEKYTHNVGVCYRCGTVIEPLPLPQFFIRVAPLTQKALKAVESKDTVIYGAGHDKILKNWLKNLEDWNISRQIVWGIRIPVWYDTTKEQNQKIVVGFLNRSGAFVKGSLSELLNTYSLNEIEKGLQTLMAPADAEYELSRTKPGKDYLQETDTFDTWFSSSQWPVVTLKVNKPGDFEYYYPTTVLETAYDILMFWVMRMMMMGIYLTGKSPFKQVYLHGLIRDERGQKMSKSKGNVINPLSLVDVYGADALRMALVMSTTAGKDSSVGEQKVKGMRNFANKIWNAARFVYEFKTKEQPVNNARAKNDKKMKQHLDMVYTRVGKQLDALKVGLAAETVHNEFWHWFCDECIEKAKKGELSPTAIEKTLKRFLIILHPFTPFATEAVWDELGYAKDAGLLCTQNWQSE